MSSYQHSDLISYYDPNQITEKDAITLSEAALAHFKKEIQKRGSGMGIRLSLVKSGCTGYRYVIDLVDAQQADDKIVKITEDFILFVAADCFHKVRGSRIEYIQKGLNKIIQINNPNETARCGCGESFSTE